MAFPVVIRILPGLISKNIARSEPRAPLNVAQSQAPLILILIFLSLLLSFSHVANVPLDYLLFFMSIISGADFSVIE